MDVPALLGTPRLVAGAVPPPFTIGPARDAAELAAYRALRHASFVAAQGRFAGSDHDEVDDDPRAVVLLAREHAGTVLGGVRLAPCTDPEIGWWAGSRLVVARGAPNRAGAALVRAACSSAEAAGALRFDACVQADKEPFFARLGWERVRDVHRYGGPHVLMRWPIHRLRAQAASKAPIGELVAALSPGGDGWVGDDGVPIPGSEIIAACDAIQPSMLERDPRWAGWCSVLVNANDLAAMGATPVGLLDALGAPTVSLAQRVVAGLRDAAEAYGVPVLGGHTQLGVPASLAVTMLGRTATPIPGGGGRPGDVVSVAADLRGRWRPGYAGRQWDSTTSRSRDELRRGVRTLQHAPPAAAKDISMAGLVGTLGMLAEASGTGAELDLARVPRPDEATFADWLTCFPGLGFVTADRVPLEVGDAPVTAATCGRLTTTPGVRLRWPDGEITDALTDPVTGLGPATSTTKETPHDAPA